MGLFLSWIAVLEASSETLAQLTFPLFCKNTPPTLNSKTISHAAEVTHAQLEAAS